MLMESGEMCMPESLLYDVWTSSVFLCFSLALSIPSLGHKDCSMMTVLCTQGLGVQGPQQEQYSSYRGVEHDLRQT